MTKLTEDRGQLTCGSCKYIGKAYWGDNSDCGGRIHFCGKSSERRRDTMKPTGDAAEDFMRNFRAFFDARATTTACRYYEERDPADSQRLRVLVLMSEAGGKSAFGFFSEENSLCEKMNGTFVERDHWAGSRRSPSDGTRDWMLTHLGKAELARTAINMD